MWQIEKLVSNNNNNLCRIFKKSNRHGKIVLKFSDQGIFILTG